MPLFPPTDLGAAERFAFQHRDHAKYVSGLGWFVWDGTRWVLARLGEIGILAKQTVRAIDLEVARCLDDAQRKRLRDFATKEESRAGIENMQALARSELAATSDEFDKDPLLLNCTNGTLDLRTCTLRPHDRKDLITKTTGVAYDPHATCPRWDAFLAHVMDSNPALISYLQRLVGYALTGLTREHVLIFLCGDGANGKSVFLNAGMGILGDYASKAPRSLLNRSKGDRHPTELADLFGVRLAICAEIDGGQCWDESQVKDLVGEDLVKARKMHQDFFPFKPTHKIFIAGNHKPYIKGTDQGIWRRIRLVPWTVTISEQERDLNLLAKLEEERAGILAWAVRGCIEWQRHGLGDPPEVKNATAAFREESDPLREFYDAHCVFDSDGKVSRKGLRAVYERWCLDVGAEAVGNRRFADSLKERGVVDGGSVRVPGEQQPVNAWRGLRLLTRQEVESRL